MNVLIGGMHRSGTSAMAQVLSASGLSSGPDESLMTARPENPAGFHERHAVMALDDALLGSLGWTWDAPAPEPFPFPPARTAMVDRGRALMDTLMARDVPVVVKDPRISLLLPWWRQIVLDRCVVIVMIRPREEVAWSLWVRDGLPLALGHALWAAYHRHLAAGLRGLPVIVVEYAALTSHPEDVVAQVLHALAGSGVRVPARPRSPARVIDPMLRRATQPPARPDEPDVDGLEPMAAAWSMGAVRVLERFTLEVPAPTRWETGILEVHRRARGQELAAIAAERRADEAEQRLRDAGGQRVPPVPPVPPVPHAVPAPPAPAAPEVAPGPGPGSMGGDATAIPRPNGGLRLASWLRGRIRRLALRAGLPNPLFDGRWYRATYPDVPAGPGRAWIHWRRHGWRERRDPNARFHAGWYLARNPDVRQAGVDPLEHYLVHGAAEGRAPGPGSEDAGASPEAGRGRD